MKQAGSATLLFENRPYVLSAASTAGKAEEKGPFGHAFDEIMEDDRLGEKTFELGERKMLLKTLRRAMKRVGLSMEEAGCLLAGDLLNQIVTASFAARELAIPYLGLYEPLVDWAGAGATVPLTGFGFALSQGAKKAVAEQGLLGAFTGGITATAGGIAAAILFGYLFALLARPQTKM